MTNLDKYNSILKECLNITEICLCDEVMTYNTMPRWTEEIHNAIISELEKTFQVQFGDEELATFKNYSTGIAILEEQGVDMSV